MRKRTINRVHVDSYVELAYFHAAEDVYEEEGQLRTKVDLLDPAPWLKVVVDTAVQLLPFTVAETTSEMAQVHKVKLGAPCPWLGNVVHFEDAVWGSPGSWRRVQVDTTDGNWYVLAAGEANNAPTPYCLDIDLPHLKPSHHSQFQGL